MIFLIFCQFALAESLFSHNVYDLAVVEYKRLFFFDSTTRKDFRLRLHYTIACVNQDFYKGYEETDRFMKDFPEIGNESRLMLSRVLIKNGIYGMAIEILRPTQEYRLLGFSYLYNHQYINALREFQNVDEEIVREVEKLIKRPEKSITKAMLLSAILPGSGEIYAGNIKQGLQDFILTSLSGFLLYNSIKNKKYVDAGLVFSFLFNRFYFGSISNAGSIVRNYNEKLEEKWLHSITAKYYSD
ncbi:MAG: hypothetical protein ABIL20_07230 [candidate division WOR-3 bacterium]